MLSSTMGATAGPGELGAVAKDEAAVRTGRGFVDEAAGTVPRERLDRVGEVIFDLPLRNSESLRELIGGETAADKQFDEALARRPVRRQHRGIVGFSRRNSKRRRPDGRLARRARV